MHNQHRRHKRKKVKEMEFHRKNERCSSFQRIVGVASACLLRLMMPRSVIQLFLRTIIRFYHYLQPDLSRMRDKISVLYYKCFSQSNAVPLV